MERRQAMAEFTKPRTGESNSRLWGARARDWAEIQERQCSPVYHVVFAKVGLKDGTKYLDAGCGAGMAAQIASELGADVTGVDAAPNLLAIAKERIPAGTFHQGDLESLPFPNHTFDCVTGFNSFQFAGDPGTALREAKRVARPGASVVIMTWGKPEGMEAASLLAALRPLMPPPPPGAPGPFALSDEASLRAFASGAGLKPLEILDVDCPWIYPSLESGLRGLRSSGGAARAIENSSESAVDEAHSKALAPFRQSNGTYRIGAVFRCLIAEA
jgi:SAM-dependent methyltransferase